MWSELVIRLKVERYLVMHQDVVDDPLRLLSQWSALRLTHILDRRVDECWHVDPVLIDLVFNHFMSFSVLLFGHRVAIAWVGTRLLLLRSWYCLGCFLYMSFSLAIERLALRHAHVARDLVHFRLEALHRVCSVSRNCTWLLATSGATHTLHHIQTLKINLENRLRNKPVSTGPRQIWVILTRHGCSLLMAGLCSTHLPVEGSSTWLACTIAWSLVVLNCPAQFRSVSQLPL